MSGLQVNLGKSAYVTKGVLVDPIMTYMTQSGLQHAKCVRYLGVQVGHVSTKEAFRGPLHEAFCRAGIAATVSLLIPQRIPLLMSWIFPTLRLTTRAYVADASVTSTVNNVYNVLFGFDNWGITAHQLSQHRDKGGYTVPMPKTWLVAQGGAASVTVLAIPKVIPTSVLQAFMKFCNPYATPMNHHVLAVTQLGSVPMKSTGYLATSYKAYSMEGSQNETQRAHRRIAIMALHYFSRPPQQHILLPPPCPSGRGSTKCRTYLTTTCTYARTWPNTSRPLGFQYIS